MEDNVIKIIISIQKQIKDLGCSVNNYQLQTDLLRCMKDLKIAISNYMEGEENMNNIRRKRIEEAKKMLGQVNNIIYEVLSEEEDAFNNLSEGLQQTARGEQMEENIDEMDEAIEKISDAINNLENIY